MEPTLEDAIELAKRAHAGQTDKSGAPYFGHLERVMNSLDEPDLKRVAVLHDILEDTATTRADLEAACYAPRIITAIEGVTKRPEEEGSDAGYFRFVKRAAQNSLSRAVKRADLLDNLDASRLAHISAKDEARLTKYRCALALLDE